MRDTIIMQKTLLALLMTLLFTGCMERGQSLKPAPVHTLPIKTKPTQTLSKIKPIKLEKSKVIPASKIPSKLKEQTPAKQTIIKADTADNISKVTHTSKKDESLFALSDETKNKISGFFIIIIGIIILL